ncbi:putative lipoprotein [Treponema primitia ZAS-2]|uniref:Putative lipoprotein n=1 Tax=Treponema primitia (strain ATCC BAA-887 / DSM 12427 / ZAS-2) TaxID=545694 RepID=F5YIH3_TREPZ|nr:penicillin-binding protein activator LpoB [Treponema primitia]AEF86838.1 putative lipoprotein [Treponema primitia ZAS-2]
MKTHVLFAVTAAALFALFSSCSSGPVTRVSADTQVDLSGRWNDTDVRQVCESLIAGCLSAPSVDRFINTYSTSHQGELPTVLVGNFRNTSSEHIDTTIISGIMRSAIINSGKLEFVAGGDTRDELRAERQEQQSNASEASAAALGNETGATFMLNGTVQAIVDRNGNTSVRSYFVHASLTNIETNRILWEGENNEIKKVINQAKLKP